MDVGRAVSIYIEFLKPETLGANAMRARHLRSAGVALGALLGLCGPSGPARASSVAAGAEAPNFAGTWLNHETTTLKDLRGLAVLIEFWGTT